MLRMFEDLGDRDLRAGFKKPGFSVYALSPNNISRRNRVSGPGCKVRDRTRYVVALGRSFIYILRAPKGNYVPVSKKLFLPP
jgi:hypothetical protein